MHLKFLVDSKFPYSSNVIGAEETDNEGEESEACEKNASDASLHTAKEDEKEHLDFPITALSEISRLSILLISIFIQYFHILSLSVMFKFT